MGIDPHGLMDDLPFIDARLDLAREDHVSRLEATVAEHDPRLVVIDPLVSAHMGLDENASGDVMKVLNPLRDLITARPDTSLLLVHHHGKAGGERSRNHGLRGSSAIGGWWDSLITLQRAKDDSAAPRRVDVEHRDAPAPEPAGFQLAMGSAEREGHPELSWFCLDACEPPEVGGNRGGQSALSKAKEVAKGAMVAGARREPGIYRGAHALAKAAGIMVGERAARGYVNELVEEGELRRDDEGGIHPGGEQ